MTSRATASSLAVLCFLLCCVTTLAAAQSADKPQVMLQAALHQEMVEGDLDRAIKLYRDIVADGADREVTAIALLYLGRSYEKIGSTEALNAYRTLASNYGDQGEAAGMARARLAAIDAGEEVLDDRGIVIRQVWARQAGATAVSPDGRYLSFVDWAAGFGGDPNLRGHADLAVYDSETGRSRVLTESPSLSASDSWVVDAIFSPGGDRLAYTIQFNDGEGYKWQLRVVNADGTDDRLLHQTSGSEFIQTGSWSSDGSFMVMLFRDADGEINIATVSLRDGAVRVIKQIGRHSAARPVSLSPDGRYVVYDNLQQAGDPKHDVYLVAVDGSSEGRLVSGPADEDRPLWTPDGERVVFVSDRTGRRALWAVEVSDGRPVSEPEMVRPDIGTMVPLGFDADGTLFYRQSNRVLDVYSAELSADGNSFAAGPAPITDRYVGTNEGPAWSPEGNRVAFVSYRGAGARGDKHLVVRDLRTGEEREYPFEHADLRNPVSPRWASAGNSLTLEARSTLDNSLTTYRLDLASGRWTPDRHVRDVAGRQRRATDRQIEGLRTANVRLLWGFNGAAGLAGVDQQLLGVFETGVFRASPAQVIRSGDINDPAVTALFRTLHIHSWDLSPDGRRLALASAEDSTTSDSLVSKVMRILPVAGGEAVEVFRVSGSYEIVATRWAPDGNSLLLRVQNTSDRADGAVWRVPLGSGEPVRTSLPLTEPQLRRLDFHPDGRRVAYHTSDGWSEIWAMEGFPWTED